MPWFPDFVTAAELARRQTRDPGQAVPAGRYLTSLSEGDTRPVEGARGLATIRIASSKTGPDAIRPRPASRASRPHYAMTEPPRRHAVDRGSCPGDWPPSI
jgi:hypothetical protein